MPNQSFIAFSVFHLYISLIKSYELKKKHAGLKVYLFITDHVPGVEGLLPKIKKLGIFDDVFFINDFQIQKEYPNQPVLKRFFFRGKLLTKLYAESINKTFIHVISESEINLFIDSTQFTQWLFYRFPDNFYRLYEDGERIYMEPKDGWKHWVKYKLLGYPKKHGRDKQVKEIIAQRPEKLPPAIVAKAKKFNLNKLTEALSSNEKNAIIDLFLENISIKSFPQEKTALLITQPLSEDKIVTEDYKTELYKGIISKYCEGFKVYIKPHPREITDYKNFEDVTVLPGSFPLEILNYSGHIKFEKGITLFSSAINNLNFIEEKIFLGIEWDKLVADNFNFKVSK